MLYDLPLWRSTPRPSIPSIYATPITMLIAKGNILTYTGGIALLQPPPHYDLGRGGTLIPRVSHVISMTTIATEEHVHSCFPLRYPNHDCTDGGTSMYTGGFYRLRYPQSRLQQKRHDYQPAVSSHAMPMTTIPTDVSLCIISSKIGNGKVILRSWGLGV